MNIILKNDNGYSIEIGQDSPVRLMDYPDFGSVSSVFNSAKIPNIDGEMLKSSVLGVRDIILKFEVGDCPTIQRVLSPKSGITLYFDGKWFIKGYLNGTPKVSNPAYLMPSVYTVSIRCFDPYFYRVNGTKSASFDNSGVTLYQNGNYNYQIVNLNNDGDVPCPLYVTMRPKYALSGLFTTALYNSGSPIYKGFKFGSSASVGTDYFFTTDLTSDRIFESYNMLTSPIIWNAGIGKNTLYALNSKGTVYINPRFLSIEGGVS